MNRKIIPLQVRDEYIIGAGGVIGAEGSGNDVALQLEFGAMWEGLVKYVTFRDALGENPEVLMVTADMMELLKEEKMEQPPRPEPGRFPPPPPPPYFPPKHGLVPPPPPPLKEEDGEEPPEKPVSYRVVYNVPVPKKAKAVSGEMMVTVHGYAVNEDGTQKEAATVGATAYFRVLPAKWAEPETEGFEPPTIAQQMQAQIERIQTDIVEAAKAADAKEAAQKSAEKAEESAATADKVIKDAAAAEAARVEAEAARAAAEQQRADTDAGIVAKATEKAEAAAQAAQVAQESKEAIEGMTVSAVGLPSGQAATVEKTENGGVVNLNFGLPAGPQGPPGELDDGAVTAVKLADGAVTWPKLAVDARPTRRNLLDNAYFVGGGSQQGGGQFPINQRGQTEYSNNTQSFIYSIDRWTSTAMKVTVQADGVKIESYPDGYKRFVQMLSRQMKAGRQYTLSLLADIESVGGTVMFRPASNHSPYAGYLSIGNATPGVKLYTYTFTPTVDSTSGEVEILCMDGASDHITATLKAWKLELGPNQTLAHQDADGNWVLNSPPPDFALELAKCQRYQLFGPLTSIHISKATDDTIRVFVPTPVTLRGNPAIVGTIGSNIHAFSVATNSKLREFTLGLNEVIKNGIFLNVKGLSEPAYIWFYSGAGFDCNL